MCFELFDDPQDNKTKLNDTDKINKEIFIIK